MIHSFFLVFTQARSTTGLQTAYRRSIAHSIYYSFITPINEAFLKERCCGICESPSHSVVNLKPKRYSDINLLLVYESGALCKLSAMACQG
ncbi:hypothetical protein BDA96_05G037500 [Sorghum bicolor]|uniref:Uncharacterized protein n=1 Tax=Sorghum bicolor TaxID=4558 RepID=A0A921UEH8_SORBI|nr:hypothetical protein BDA96_05G037500 [Sorghum bicolor]